MIFSPLTMLLLSLRYRKIKKKDRERSKLSLEELRAIDPEMARREEEKMLQERAQERLTLRHKNTSKWVQHALHKGQTADEEVCV